MVLLIEDEDMIRFITINLLEHFNYQVLAAKSGEDAVELFKKHREEVRLAICDLVMPGMDGWQTLEALRKLAPELPVIFASGYDQSLIMKGCRKELPDAFLRKPYGVMALRQAIAQALGKN
jgi:CheY-like chemotaxis protein